MLVLEPVRDLYDDGLILGQATKRTPETVTVQVGWRGWMAVDGCGC